MPIVVFLHGGAYVRGSPEHSKWRGRLSTGETEQHAAEQWLRTIQQEIEEKLLTRRSSSGGVEALIR